MARQITLNIILDKFLGKIPLTGPTLAEIKSAIDEQKLTSEIVNKFFEGSNPQDITTKFSNIDWYIKDQEQLGIRDLLISFFSNEYRRMMNYNEIKANYLNIYDDISSLKEKFENVKIPHSHVGVKNIVYTVEYGTKDWIRDVYTTLSIGIAGIAVGGGGPATGQRGSIVSTG